MGLPGWEDVMIRHVAEINCLACGRDLGRIEKASGEMRRIPAEESPSAAEAVLKRGHGLVCGRCGGRALVGPLERIFSYTTADDAAKAREEREEREAA
jgi:DNA-directed RNA polymerase subunit RPC12/RpoP